MPVGRLGPASFVRQPNKENKNDIQQTVLNKKAFSNSGLLLFSQLNCVPTDG